MRNPQTWAAHEHPVSGVIPNGVLALLSLFEANANIVLEQPDEDRCGDESATAERIRAAMLPPAEAMP